MKKGARKKWTSSFRRREKKQRLDSEHRKLRFIGTDQNCSERFDFVAFVLQEYITQVHSEERDRSEDVRQEMRSRMKADLHKCVEEQRQVRTRTQENMIALACDWLVGEQR